MLPATLRRPLAAAAACAGLLIAAGALAPRDSGVPLATGPDAPTPVARPAIGIDVADAVGLRASWVRKCSVNQA